jgi:hypothetical protein
MKKTGYTGQVDKTLLKGLENAKEGVLGRSEQAAKL